MAKPELSLGEYWVTLLWVIAGWGGQPWDGVPGHLTLEQDLSILGSLCPIFKSEAQQKALAVGDGTEGWDSQQPTPHCSGPASTGHLMKRLP